MHFQYTSNTNAIYYRATVQYEKQKFDATMKDLNDEETLASDDNAVEKQKLVVDSQKTTTLKSNENAITKKMFEYSRMYKKV